MQTIERPLHAAGPAPEPQHAESVHAFTSAAWLDALRATTDYDVVEIGPSENGDDVGRLVAIRVGRRLESHALVPYAGPWATRTLSDHIQADCDSAQLDLHPSCTDVESFLTSSWSTEQRRTLISDLTLNIEAAVAPAVRRRARKAASAGVEFDARVAPAEFIDLWRQTCKRRALGDYLNPDALARLLHRVVNEATAEILGARLPNGTLVAANVLVYDESCAYFWLSGFDPSEPNRGAANQLCHLQSLLRAARRVPRFDWLGANTPGVTEYKRSFGPRVETYHRLRWSQPRPSDSSWRGWLRACPLLGSFKSW